MKTRRLLKSSALVLAFVVLGGSLAVAAGLGVVADQLTALQTATTVPVTSCTLNPVADTYGDRASQNANFGTSQTLTVRSQKNGNARTFVRFDLSGCSPAIASNASIQSAQLGLFTATVPGTTRTYEARRVTTAWNETTLTWGGGVGQPTVAGAATSTQTTPGAAGAFMSWSVLADVQGFVTGALVNNGWRVADTVEDQDPGLSEATFRSREFGTATQRPQLVITYYP